MEKIKFEIMVETEEGEKKVNVWVEKRTAKLLRQCSEDFQQVYLREEYESQKKERAETRRHQSLEYTMESGLDFEDENADTYTIAEKKEWTSYVVEGLNYLEPQQKMLVQQVFYEGQSVTELAAKYGVSKAAISCRLQKIYIKLKKFCEKGLNK